MLNTACCQAVLQIAFMGMHVLLQCALAMQPGSHTTPIPSLLAAPLRSRVLALAYRDISVPAETVGPPRPVPADAAWQTLGGRLTGSDSDDSRWACCCQELHRSMSGWQHDGSPLQEQQQWQ